MTANVLLVDDERDFTDLLAERLEARGLSVRKAYDAAGALAAIEAEDVEVAVLDVNLPDQSGLDLIRALKQVRPLLEVVLLTGQQSIRTAVEGMKRGARDYLVKPVDIEALLAAVRQAREHRRGQTESRRIIDAGRLAALGVLAEGVAHEINNPVNVMVQEAGWIRDLLAEPVAPGSTGHAEALESLAKIKAQGQRCKAITLKLLQFGQRMDTRRRPVQLNDVVRKVLSEREPRARSLDVRITAELSPAIPVLPLSPVEMEHLVGNLADNALDAMEYLGGELVVATRVEGDSLLLEVRDTGSGISPENLPRIYEPFFSTKEVGKGTGLGLSICHGIVNTLAGSIEAESVEHRGSVFRVRIPLAGASAA